MSENTAVSKAVITVVGRDTVGIIAGVTQYLAEREVNILDISQTIVDGFFNMMMIVDISGVENEFDNLVNGLNEVGNSIGVSIRCQRAEIFTTMHRV